jgi:hypothetical protein
MSESWKRSRLQGGAREALLYVVQGWITRITQVSPPGPDRYPVHRNRSFADPLKNPGQGRCHLLDPLKNPGEERCQLVRSPSGTGRVCGRCSGETKNRKFNSLYNPQNLFLEKLHRALELLSTSPTGPQPFVILTVGGDGIGPCVPTQPVSVLETITSDGSQTCLFVLYSGRLSDLHHTSTRILKSTLFFLLSWRTIHLTSLSNSFMTERVLR